MQEPGGEEARPVRAAAYQVPDLITERPRLADVNVTLGAISVLLLQFYIFGISTQFEMRYLVPLLANCWSTTTFSIVTLHIRRAPHSRFAPMVAHLQGPALLVNALTDTYLLMAGTQFSHADILHVEPCFTAAATHTVTGTVLQPFAHPCPAWSSWCNFRALYALVGVHPYVMNPAHDHLQQPNISRHKLRAGSVAGAGHVPCQYPVFYSLAISVLLLLKGWQILWCGLAPQDTKYGLGWLVYVTALRALRTADSLSDMALAAFLFYEWELECFEDGSSCDTYFKLMLAAAVAAGTDYTISILFVFLPAAKVGGYLHNLFHIVSLLAEGAILAVTLVLQQQASSMSTGPNHPISSQSRWFLLLSGSFTLAVFVTNVSSLRKVAKVFVWVAADKIRQIISRSRRRSTVASITRGGTGA